MAIVETAFVIEFVIFSAAALLWAKWSKLDLGFRMPALRRAWPWIAAYLAWIGAERALMAVLPMDVDPDWLDRLDRLSLLEDLLFTIVLGPLCEELLYRGALFAALLRRWGIWVAAIVPSALWGVTHVQYEVWFIAMIAGSGVLLAMVRWRSGSLYAPLALHSGYNLFDLIAAEASFPPVA